MRNRLYVYETRIVDWNGSNQRLCIEFACLTAIVETLLQRKGSLWPSVRLPRSFLVETTIWENIWENILRDPLLYREHETYAIGF